MMKLYHCENARSLRPLWTLEEMGLEMGVDFELVTMKFPPRYTYEGYKALNPLGTVPFFEDGDVQMTESAGISQYLVDRYGPTPLAVEKDDPDYGAYLNWLHRSDATLTFPLTLTLRYTRLEPEERRVPQVAADYRAWFLARARCIEEATADRDYLCAGRFTIADICIGFSIHFALQLNVDEILTPNISKYWDRISARDGFKRALAHKFDGPAENVFAD
jgi:glutathione S-transferase